MASSPSEINSGGLARSAPADVSFRNSGSGTQCGNMGDGPQNVNSGPGYQFNVQRQYIGVPSSEKPDPLQECQKSLAFPEMNNRTHDIDDAVDGTCEWLPLHETYINWANCDRGLLWIKGKPGSGKSTLLKHVLRRVETKPGMGDESIALSFFFHGRGSKLQKTPLGLFRSLLHQLLTRVPDSLSQLVDAFQQRCGTIGTVGNKWQWHARELRDFFQSSLLTVLGRWSVVLFVDALDECGEENAVYLVECFKLLVKKLPPFTSRFRICFSCRHYPILELDYGSEICMEDGNMRDITVFVQTQLSTLRIRSASTIANTITRRALGVFMWARLVVERVLALARRGEGLKKIKAEIRRIPPELDALYDELVRSMEDMAMSQKMIQWICFSTKPLSIEELRWALAIDPDHPHKSMQLCQKSEDYTWDNETMERRIKTLSCGLAETNIGWPSEDRVKLWVRVYRTVRRSSSDCPSEGTSLLHVISRYKLTQLLSVILQKAEKSTLDINCPDNDGCTPLLWAAVEGHKAIVKLLLATGKVDIDAGDKYGRTPLSHAAEHGHKALVKLLLDTGEADVNAVCCFLQTPLFYAVKFGHEAVIKLLLATGSVSVDAGDGYGRTPLLYAAKHGHAVIVKLLLDTGDVDVNVGDYCGKTPLSYAAKRGNEDIVKLLLATDQVDVAATSSYPRTPLLYAAERGYAAVVKLLLDAGNGNFNGGGHFRQTALLYAAKLGHEDIVKLLLAIGKVNVDAKDRYRRTPLLYAADHGRAAVVKLLLDTGNVNVDARDRYYRRTPLQWATKRGHAAVVELLQRYSGRAVSS
ncbi:ankyrin repeat-containing protein [Ilyonectria robusta]